MHQYHIPVPFTWRSEPPPQIVFGSRNQKNSRNNSRILAYSNLKRRPKEFPRNPRMLLHHLYPTLAFEIQRWMSSDWIISPLPGKGAWLRRNQRKWWGKHVEAISYPKYISECHFGDFMLPATDPEGLHIEWCVTWEIFHLRRGRLEISLCIPLSCCTCGINAYVHLLLIVVHI